MFAIILFHTDAYLKDSGRPFPNQLLGNHLRGLSYSHRTDDGWTVGGSFSAGSPSDRPFHSLREVVPSVTGFVRMPAARAGDAWLYSVSWVPVSLIRFPLPGIAYEWNASEQLQVVARVPFSIVWRSDRPISFDVGYMPPFQTRAQATYRILNNVDVFAGFESINEAYLLDDRTHCAISFTATKNGFPPGCVFGSAIIAWSTLPGGYLFDPHLFHIAIVHG